MNIDITENALSWFQTELGAQPGDGVQFFVRYGGCGNIQSGFSLGVVKKNPEDPGVTVKKGDITFFIEKKDEWYFENRDFEVNFNKDKDEIEFHHN
ncbi:MULTISPECIES: HesB/YadR/YfhF family protein [Bacillaceae]|uniref:HesB/YadR/YfhF family protein n=1 Tax=Evansella alkalicola TaxID=745819 RepID=A0ABS6JUP7_9BACI|nr:MULTISPECIES: HesB/YadR/YfhF family protein [Bacillaceae]MBU9721816.1 HesB/YadR/YfhF family protein [Bacillus alkalicola]